MQEIQFQSKSQSQNTSNYQNKNLILYQKNTQQQLDQALEASKKRFKKFCDSLGTLKTNHISADILNYAFSKLKKKTEDIKKLNYYIVCHLMFNRIDKMKRSQSLKRKWSEDDLKILTWIVYMYCQLKDIKNHQKQLAIQDWKFIATLIPMVTAQSCMFKWLSLKTVSLTQCQWSAQQSQILKNLIKARIPDQKANCSQVKKDWKQISIQLYNLYQNPNKTYRNFKQCRQHWSSHINNNARKCQFWSNQQDIKLLSCLYNNKFRKKWTQMVKSFDNNRNQNALKNRFNLLMQKMRKKHSTKNYTQQSLIKLYLHQNNLLNIQDFDYQLSQNSGQYVKKQQSNIDYQDYFNVNKQFLKQQKGQYKQLQLKQQFNQLQNNSSHYIQKQKQQYLDNNKENIIKIQQQQIKAFDYSIYQFNMPIYYESEEESNHFFIFQDNFQQN